jgi:hypothetical protein
MKPYIKQFFEFLEKKENRKVPLTTKLLNPKDFKLSPEDLNVKGDLDLEDTSIDYLPDNLTVERNLILANTSIQSLPDNFKVGRNLDLEYTLIQSLPNNLTVGGSLLLSFSDIESLPNNLKVGEDLDLEDTPLAEKYPKNQIRSMIEEKGGYVKGNIFV